MNAVKHAFPDGRTGTITVELTRHDETIVCSVSDDGVGTTDGYQRPGGIGTHLINRLAGQVKAKLEFVQPDVGTKVVVTAPLRK
jgi:two-component sensor histidine kinase